MIVLDGPRHTIDPIVFSPDGTMISAPVPSKGLYRWHVAEGPKASVLYENEVFRSIQYSPDGKWLILGGRGMVLLSDSNTSLDVSFSSNETEWGRVYASFAPNSRRFIAVLESFSGDPRTRMVCRTVGEFAVDMWSADVTRYLRSVPLFVPGGSRFVTFETWVGATNGEYGQAFVTRLASTGEVVSEYRESTKGYGRPVQSSDLSLVAAWFDNRIRVYRIEDFSTPLAEISDSHVKGFFSIAFHPSGRYLAATSGDTVKMYDTDTWELAQTYDWGVGRLQGVAFSPDGALGAVASATGKRKIVVWDVDL